MTRSPALALLLLCSAPSVHAAAVRVQPDTAWLERGRGLQRVHADLRFEHRGRTRSSW